jgi:hypothetical protein
MKIPFISPNLHFQIEQQVSDSKNEQLTAIAVFEVRCQKLSNLEHRTGL